MSLPTKTCPGMVKKVARVLGNFEVVHHKPTTTNRLGQSGIHTFLDDILDVVLNAKHEHEALQNLARFLKEGQLGER